MDKLYIFIDESGDFNFSPTGSKYLILCSYSTVLPLQHSHAFQKLKYDLLAQGIEQECFHATEDKQHVRDKVYDIIHNSRQSVIDYVWIEKAKAHPKLHRKQEAYTLLGRVLIKYIFERISRGEYTIDQIVVVVDKLLTAKEKGYLKSAIKPHLNSTGIKYELFFFQTKADPNAQIADYGAWAKHVQLVKDEQRPMQKIQHIVANDFDIFRLGTTRYY
jgi:hypothetical protein